MTQEAEIKPIVQMTETAARELKAYLGKQGKPSAGLRVFVTAGGCSGLSYGMVPDERITEDDYVVEAYGAKVIVDKSSAPFIAGSRSEERRVGKECRGRGGGSAWKVTVE